MKDFGAVYHSIETLDRIDNIIREELNGSYMDICCSLVEGHEPQTIEWYQSADFEDSLKIEEYHERIKSALQSLYEARAILLQSHIGQSVLVNEEIATYDDYINGRYCRLYDFPTIVVRRENPFPDDDEDRYYEETHVCYDVSASELKEWNEERLLSYLKENCVGKCNTVAGTNEYFIPCIEFGKLKISAQVNYRIWSYRQDKNFTKEQHALVITEEEFDEVIDVDTWIDVAVSYNGVRLMMGQANIHDIIGFLLRLADFHAAHVSIDEYQL